MKERGLDRFRRSVRQARARYAPDRQWTGTVRLDQDFERRILKYLGVKN